MSEEFGSLGEECAYIHARQGADGLRKFLTEARSPSDEIRERVERELSRDEDFTSADREMLRSTTSFVGRDMLDDAAKELRALKLNDAADVVEQIAATLPKPPLMGLEQDIADAMNPCAGWLAKEDLAPEIRDAITGSRRTDIRAGCASLYRRSNSKDRATILQRMAEAGCLPEDLHFVARSIRITRRKPKLADGTYGAWIHIPEAEHWARVDNLVSEALKAAGRTDD
jgi:hypothetical protein